jgi:serine/threonine protein kinase
LCSAIQADTSGDLLWYGLGHRIALDIARGLYFLHSHEVPNRAHRLCGVQCAPCSEFAYGWDLVGQHVRALHDGFLIPRADLFPFSPRTQVVHADVKSKNVLLNGAMHAKISDVRVAGCLAALTCMSVLTISCAECTLADLTLAEVVPLYVLA